MDLLLSTYGLRKSFGSRQLFNGISFAVEARDRIGLIGPNGAGKSTLLKILAREETPDAGDVTYARGLRIGFLQQTPTFAASTTIYEALVSVGDPHDPLHLGRVDEWMSRLDLNQDGRSPETQVSLLSGGWQKRVALARELVKAPDLLLLDEPTNHLDVEGILWLESFLAGSDLALLMVTHDRLFLQRTANRILDLDSRYKDGLLSTKGSYADYLESREQLLAAQQRHEEVLRNQLRRETEWLRRGAKARQTKQKARIERAGDLGRETEDVSARNLDRKAKIEFQDAERKPQKLIEIKEATIARGGRTLFADLNLLVSPKSRIALLGPNGCGKSTLIRILMKTEEPDAGQVSHAEQTKIAWFEQHRDALNPDLPLLRAVCPEGDYVQYQGRAIFARAYLSRFLFRPEQMDMPIQKLSGGEKSRLRVAQMMLTPCNVLILDEPTNDLDTATLDVLAASLEEFDGAVILVTHDRFFLDQVANEVLAFPIHDEDDRHLQRFAGYEQWEAWHDSMEKGRKAAAATPTASASPAANTAPAEKKKKLGYKEKREWEMMEGTILEKESELEDLQKEAAAPEVASNAKRVSELFERMASLQSEIERLYARWAELEELVK